MSEVLATQPPAMREFLLRTCLVDELQPGLVEALTGVHCDSRVLRFLAHGNSFIEPCRGVRDRYRYQPLFREFLRSQLAFESPARARAPGAAADWYAQNGQLPAAIRQAALGRTGEGHAVRRRRTLLRKRADATPAHLAEDGARAPPR